VTTLFDPSALVPAPASQPGAGPRPRVIGLDLSLTCTGIASITLPTDNDGRPTVDLLDKLKYRHTGRSHMRLSWLRCEIADRTDGAALVVVEGPAYGRGAQAGHHELAGLWWIITHHLWRRQIPYAVCPPKVRAMYATGNGNAEKGEVRSGVAQHFGVECEGTGRYDKADALSMAALGAHWLGYPLADLPDRHTRALAGVAWPDTVPAVAR
jgi:Holliday junction resolvasome RuvABC endonuclease subunit